jgi:GNAT superfamily N-acetyltransferase
MTEVITAGAADLEALSHVIAEAFCDLPPSQWLIAGRDDRRQIFPAYLRIYLDHALACGLICTTPDRDAAALWIPAGQDPPGPPPGYAERLRAATIPWTRKFQTLDAALTRRHPARTAHHHLAILAVQPGRQGHGTGTALLDSYHPILDQSGTPGHLEASSNRNRQLYLRHGYADLGPPIRLPGGPPMQPMWRQPRPRGDES